MSAAIYAIIGIMLAVLLTVGISAIPVPSGDRTIEPEGERDPGRFGYPAEKTHTPDTISGSGVIR